jgi:protein associated with RNAse G/E
VSHPVKEILLRQLKHDGVCYRHHLTQLVAQLPAGLVLLSPRKTEIWDSRRSWQAENDVYHYGWYDRWYNLLEVVDPDDKLLEVYVHIASPIALADGVVSYIDYELDVTSLDGPRLVDEDEFAEAVEKYGYSTELQERCYTAAAEALAFVGRWQVGLPPEEALAQIDGIGA